MEKDIIRYIYKLLLLIGCTVGSILPSHAGDFYGTEKMKTAIADSIMEKVIYIAPLYESMIESYQADLYIKGRVNVRKKNQIVKFLPSMFHVRKGVSEYIMESYNDLKFTYPDVYDQKVVASVGTASNFWELDGSLPEYFHVNIYSSTLLYEKLLSPLAPNAKKYYKYKLESVSGEGQNRVFKIRFSPKAKSYQLVEGYMLVSDNVFSIREMRFSGESEFLKFNNLVRMGGIGEDNELLPVSFEVEATFGFIGNKIDGYYTAILNYKEVKRSTVMHGGVQKGKSRYDLSESFTMSCNREQMKRDTAEFNRLRPIELKPEEKELYLRYYKAREDTSGRKRKKKSMLFLSSLGDALIRRYTVNMDKMGSIRCSPLINPFLLSYSRKNGVAYRQEFKYNRFYSHDRLLNITPRLGYNFKQKQFYWSVKSNWEYWPKKRMALQMEVGSGNRIYSSKIISQLKQIPDSIFSFKDIHLDYFRNLYMDIHNSWEITNGLTLNLGLSIHRRSEVNASTYGFKDEETEAPHPDKLDAETDKEEVRNKVHRVYNSFAPRVKLIWAPGTYYYMNGQRKVNLYSKYPTVSVDWERGLKNILNNSSSYERIEIDVQHRFKLGLMRNICFRVGYGAFTDRENLYFADFKNFTRSNLPVGWNDEIGGVFQLLDGQWYNSAYEYARGHLTYESPFLFMTHLNRYTKHVLNERIYLNLLYVQHLNPYFEVGYGIGTNVFDVGLFAGFANGKYKEIGCKFTFELFNK